MEVWKQVPGLKNYEVSNLGRVKVKGHVRQTTGRGQFTIYLNGKARWFSTARLVLLAFIGPAPEGRPWALHKDDISEHNNLHNLYWGSPNENWNDYLRNRDNGKVKIKRIRLI